MNYRKTRCFQTRFSHHFSPNFFFRRSTLSIVEKIVSFFRIVFNCTCFELKLERTEFVPRKRTQDDGWQSGREPFVRLSKSRKCGNANNPRIVKVCLKAKRRFQASPLSKFPKQRHDPRPGLIPTPVGIITDPSHVYIDHRIFPSESRTKQFPYS